MREMKIWSGWHQEEQELEHERQHKEQQAIEGSDDSKDESCVNIDASFSGFASKETALYTSVDNGEEIK